MKRLIALLTLFAAFGFSQATSTSTTATVTVKLGTVQKTWQFILNAPITITDYHCTQPADAPAVSGSSNMMPGDSATCTVTLNRAPSFGGVQLVIGAPAPLVISADPSAATGVVFSGVTLTLPPGATVGTFLVSYPIDSPAAKDIHPLFPEQPFASIPWNTWVAVNASSIGDIWVHPDLSVDILVPCYLCGTLE